jgi:hypothetical protein
MKKESLFNCGEGNKNYGLGTGCLMNEYCITAVKKAKFVNDKLSHLVFHHK